MTAKRRGEPVRVAIPIAEMSPRVTAQMRVEHFAGIIRDVQAAAQPWLGVMRLTRHLVFWPEAAERAWLQQDIAEIAQARGCIMSLNYYQDRQCVVVRFRRARR